MALSKNSLNFSKLLLIGFFITLSFRFLECLLIFKNYGFDLSIVVSEIIGLGLDILFSSILVLLFFPFFSVNYSSRKKFFYPAFWAILIFLIVFHFIILKYFLYQLAPLDISIYQYSIKEILYTVKTSDISIISTLTIFLIFLFSLVLSVNFFRKLNFTKKIQKQIFVASAVLLAISIVSSVLFYDNSNKYSLNKTVYFIVNTVKYKFTKQDQSSSILKTSDCVTFQNLSPTKEFIDKDYPLLFKAKRDNSLGEYFQKFDTSPNIVILIVEGLNDDFIHSYKGAMLMPFLNKLKDESLYWNRCFTLGERSFAVVPSILGGLPYGQKGFTLLEKLPKHLSLVSILKSNNYYTSFFYGQGAWFHQKDRFFKYNDIDLIVDNNKYSPKYSKIIVGNDKFFWGYNDKDLFNQSLEVIDTLNQSKRLDIYFTGTSHNPFVINDNEYYTSKLETLKSAENHDFFNSYERNLKTVLFADDAIKAFFEKYKTREDYKNTIFIITGDHPMTEIPVANSLKRYHVPLMIFSDKLKRNKTFSNTVSHLDVSETILTLLSSYLSNVPSVSSSIGDQLVCNDKKHFAFMNDNREIIDYYSDGYYLSDKELYEVDSSLNIKSSQNKEMKTLMLKELNTIKSVGLYTCLNNKIISNNLYCKALGHTNFYSIESKDKVETMDEYYSLTKDIEIPNEDLLFDISFNSFAPSNRDLSVIYQITDSNKNNVLWESIGINRGKSITQGHIKIHKQSVSDSIVHFSSYIWNKNKIKLTISDLNILLRSDDCQKSSDELTQY